MGCLAGISIFAASLFKRILHRERFKVRLCDSLIRE